MNHKDQEDISYLQLSGLELKVLADIREFLYIPHIVQELVSGQKTPTLSLVLPLYEKLIVALKGLQHQLPNISHAIAASIRKLEEYLTMSRRTKVYALAIGKHISGFMGFQATTYESNASTQSLDKATVDER